MVAARVWSRQAEVAVLSSGMRGTSHCGGRGEMGGSCLDPRARATEAKALRGTERGGNGGGKRMGRRRPAAAAGSRTVPPAPRRVWYAPVSTSILGKGDGERAGPMSDRRWACLGQWGSAERGSRRRRGPEGASGLGPARPRGASPAPPAALGPPAASPAPRCRAPGVPQRPDAAPRLVPLSAAVIRFPRFPSAPH